MDPINTVNQIPILSLTGHQRKITSLIKLKNEEIASSSFDEKIKIWNTQNGGSRTIQTGHQVRTIIELNDGKIAAAVWHSIKMYDVTTGDCLKTLEVSRTNQDQIDALIELNDGRLAAASHNGTIRLWDIMSGQHESFPKAHDNNLAPIYLRKLNNKRIASWRTGINKTIKLWDTTNVNNSTTLLTGHAKSVYPIIELNDGRLVSGSFDKTIKVWDIKKAISIEIYSKQGEPAVYSLAELRSRLLDYESLNHRYKDVKVQNAENSNGSVILSTGYKKEVHSIIELGKERLAFKEKKVENGEPGIKAWDVINATCVATLRSHASAICSLVELSNGQLVSAEDAMSSDPYPEIKIWNTTTWDCLATLKGHTAPTISFLLELSSGWLASADNYGNIKLWDTSNQCCIKDLEAFEDEGDVFSIIELNNEYLALASRSDDTIKLRKIMD